MKRLLNSIIISAFLISPFISFNSIAQISNISSPSFPKQITQSKLFIETNFGIMGSTHVGITGDDKGMWNSILIKVVNSDLKEHIFINLVIS